MTVAAFMPAHITKGRLEGILVRHKTARRLRRSIKRGESRVEIRDIPPGTRQSSSIAPESRCGREVGLGQGDTPAQRDGHGGRSKHKANHVMAPVAKSRPMENGWSCSFGGVHHKDN
jgi:hypothetical protein